MRVQFILWGVFEVYPPSADAISLSSAIMQVAFFLWLAGLLSFYAKGLTSQYMSVPMSLARRMARARELAIVAYACAACFLLRSGAITVISITTATLDQGFDGLVDRTSPWEVREREHCGRRTHEEKSGCWGGDDACIQSIFLTTASMNFTRHSSLVRRWPSLPSSSCYLRCSPCACFCGITAAWRSSHDRQVAPAAPQRCCVNG